MKTVKYILSIVLICMISHICYSQSFTSESSARDYFLANIDSIDPIEGIYDIENKVVARSGPYSRTNRENYTIIIHQSSYNGFSVYNITSGGSAVLVDMRFERIGESSIYKAIIGDKKSIRFELDDLFSFGYSYNDSMGTAVSTVTFTAYKKYPTRSIYQEAINRAEEDAARKQAEEQARIQEEEAKKAGWTGSGFALKEGYVVTNYHVIEDAVNIAIQGVKGDFITKLNAKVVASDKYNDLAVLKIDDSRFTGFGTIPYSIKTSIADVAEDIFVLGYPLTTTMGDEIKYTTGVISSRTGYQGDVSLYQISAPVQPGNSGGPLFDSRGNLIGIVSAKHTGAENVGYAIKTSYLNNLVESVLSTNVLPSANIIAALSNSEKVKRLKSFVFLISCDTKKTNVAPSSIPVQSNGEIPSHAPDITISNGVKLVSNPNVASNKSGLVIKSVTMSSEKTALTLQFTNALDGGWMNVYKDAYIVANGQKFFLTKTSGIAISPEYTYFDYPGQTKTFVLFFPGIPQNVETIDFIEDGNSTWQVYGIKLH